MSCEEKILSFSLAEKDLLFTNQSHFHCRRIALLDDRGHEVLQCLQRASKKERE